MSSRRDKRQSSKTGKARTEHRTKSGLIHKRLIKGKDWWISLLLSALGDLTFPSRLLIMPQSLHNKDPQSVSSQWTSAPQRSGVLTGLINLLSFPIFFKAWRPSFVKSPKWVRVKRRWSPDRRWCSWWGEFRLLLADSRGTFLRLRALKGVSFYVGTPCLLLWASLAVIKWNKGLKYQCVSVCERERVHLIKVSEIYCTTHFSPTHFRGKSNIFW